MARPVVETRALSKTFGITPVLRGVELRIEEGRAAMLIGGNGSGKSTLLRILAGLSEPTSGDAIVFGENSRDLGDARRRIGMLTHQSWLYPNLSARENLDFYAELYGLPHRDALATKWIEAVGLGASVNERVREFSRGMEQRLAVARAMMTAPDLLLLDEPFAALDPDGVARVGELIRAAIARGCAALITAHAPLDLGIEADRYVIVNGRVMPYRDDERTRMGA
ncbi:MAG TPA: heme ABC exporter ATP-binding protein CcmA [Candidatus Binataceae bacterium]|nr:heme ABC exporter ATP-binding protein CcmA [Candidatus Binataceae bacterium]